MEAAVISALVNVLVPKIWDVIKEGHDLRAGIKQDIDIIIDNLLPFIAARIQEHELQCMSTNWETTHVINRARRLAQHTEDCICRFLYQTRRMSHKAFADSLREHKEDLKKLIEELCRLGPGSKTGFPEPRDPHFGKGDLVGMDVARKELCELLGCTRPSQPIINTGSESKGKLKVISIVGFGGSGKTRLAKQIYQDIRQEFRFYAWVCAKERNVNEVLQDLLNKIQVQQVDSSEKTLKSCLGKERYLIVIDDMRRKEDWFTLEETLPDNDVGSRIIVTTTSQPIAARCSFSNGHVYKMSTLCGGDSKELFLKALTGGSSGKVDEELSTVINICDGLPLALIESAESLKGKAVEKYGCQEAVRALCALEGGNSITLSRMQWVLMNKYTGLKSYGARSCLLYFHMFPSRNPIDRKFLTRRWLAEGFVQRAQPGFSDLDAASEHLKTLSDCNIIRSMQVSNNATVKSCRLPGTMHEFISRQSTSQNFATFLCHGTNEPAEPSYVRRLSLCDGTAKRKASLEKVPVYLLRTLAVSGEACKDVMDFSKYKLLQVLDLKECDYKLDEKRLEAICKLKMLKYLGLPGSIDVVPRNISYLKDLETLDLDVGGTEVKVYGEVIKHPKLKHLLGKFRLHGKANFTNCVPEECRLETFLGFVTNENEKFPELMKHMKMLNKVKMWCKSNAEVKDLKDVCAAIQHFILQGMTNLGERSLSINVTGCGAPFLDTVEADSGRLTKLKLHGRLGKWPEFITRLNDVRELCLSSTGMCIEFLASLKPDMLDSLKYLKLVDDELQNLEILKQHFPNLQRICLVGKKSIKSITIEAEALQNLASLHVICEHLVGLGGIQIGVLKELKEVALHSKVSKTTESDWKVAARGHPNKPQVLLIEAAPKS